MKESYVTYQKEERITKLQAPACHLYTPTFISIRFFFFFLIQIWYDLKFKWKIIKVTQEANSRIIKMEGQLCK